MELQVKLLEENSVQRFIIVGEIDAFTAPILKERLASIEIDHGIQAELNLTDVSYMDSTGLGVFVGFYKTVRENGGYLKITGLNSRLKRLFEITGLDEIIDVEMGKGGTSDATL